MVFRALLALSLSVSLGSSISLAAPGPRGNSPAQSAKAIDIAVVRKAITERDRNQALKLISILNNLAPYDADASLLVLRGMALAKPTGSLASIDRFLQENHKGSVQAYARIVRARIVAETEPNGTGNKVRIFLREAGVAVPKLNQASQLQTEETSRSTHPKVVKEMLALRELADMVYQTQEESLITEARRLGIHFQQDHQVALKLRLAEPSKAERVSTLVNELSQAIVLDEENYFKIDLLAEEGTTASQAAAAKFRSMAEARNEFRGSGFGALFKVIGRVGDQQQLEVLSRFLSDADERVARYARQNYTSLLQSVQVQ